MRLFRNYRFIRWWYFSPICKCIIYVLYLLHKFSSLTRNLRKISFLT
nr:MAG TPA: hypothetical protein [Caudoviricetes sp.]